MGAYLDTPMKDKNPESGSNQTCAWGACSMQGWRTGMEDAHIASPIDLPKTNNKGMLFGVFDGHGGKEVAVIVKDELKITLLNLDEFKNEKYEEALTKCFMNMDEKVSHEKYLKGVGCTICVVLITDTKIYCANSGDSRGVLSNSA